MSVPAELAIAGPRPLRGKIRVPGDKGISHRALLFAAMAEGRSRIVGLAGGGDVARTRHLLRDVGVHLTSAGSAVTVNGHGVESLTEAGHVLDCGNSGTTMRTAAGLLAGRPFLSVLAGDLFQGTPIRRGLMLFRLVYYANAFGHLRKSLAAWRRRAFNISDDSQMRPTRG